MRIKVHLKSPASIGTTKEAFSYGRVYYELLPELRCRDDIVIVGSAKEADMQVCWCQPYCEWEYAPWYRREHPVQIIYTTFECTRLPVGWVEEMNEMAAVFTTSRFCFETFVDNGVEVPIHVVPHGVNTEKFGYIERDWKNGRFFFIWQGVHPADRKGEPLVKKAFRELDLPDAWLIEKWHPLFSRAWHFESKRQRLIQYGLVLKPEEYRKLLAMCHVSLNPTRGEGFGMLPLEAAATGMATAITEWSGCLDYLDERRDGNPETMCFWPLKYELCKPGESYFSTSTSIELRDNAKAQDALPDYEDLKRAMLYFYHNRELAMETGRRASKYVRENWGWERAADAFVKACAKVLENVQ